MDRVRLAEAGRPLAPVGHDLFRLLLHYTAVVALRYRSDLGLVLIALERPSDVSAVEWNEALPALMDWALARAAENVRASDVVGRIGENVIGIVMPHTCARNAMLAAIRLLEGPLQPGNRPSHMPRFEAYAAVADFWPSGSVEELVATAIAALEDAEAGPPGTIRLAVPGPGTVLPLGAVGNKWADVARLADRLACGASSPWPESPGTQAAPGQPA